MNDRYRYSAMMLVAGLAAAGLFWLLSEHWHRALGVLPYLLFLTCPLMHLFMHHGHSHHHKETETPLP